MKIFYIEKDKFLQNIDIETLEQFSDGRVYKSQEKYIEHLCGLYLVKNVAKNFYNIENPEIEIKNSKPFLKNCNLFFSISHSENIVAAAFHNKNIGFDIEKIKQRNYEEILERYDIKKDNPSLEDFYKFWTLHEAQIKLGNSYVSSFTIPFGKDYILSCVSDEVIISEFDIIKWYADNCLRTA